MKITVVVKIPNVNMPIKIFIYAKPGVMCSKGTSEHHVRLRKCFQEAIGIQIFV